MPLFRIINGKVKRCLYTKFDKEKQVQTIFENNLEELLGLKFIKTEHVTADGRIDSLAIDDNGNPVIFEYKLTKNENVLSQGLFYLDWLVNHKGDFELLVQKKLGKEVKVNWNNPKLIIVASEYSRYDKHAVNAINRDISLYKYYLYGNEMLYIERINTEVGDEEKEVIIAKEKENTLETLQKSASKETVELFNVLKERILALDDSITEKITSSYVAYRASRNFVEIWFTKNYLKCIMLIPDQDEKKSGRKIPDSYRWTLNYQVDVKKLEDIDDALKLIEQSYYKTQ